MRLALRACTKKGVEVGLETRRLERGNLADAIVSDIRQQISTSALSPGSRLPPEVELAEMYGVGRNTIREAIKALCLMRLLDRSNRGTFVSEDARLYATTDLVQELHDGDHDELTDLFETRAILVGEVVELACARATDPDIAAIEAAIDEMENARNDTDKLQADLDYHRALAKAAHNRVICHFYLLTNEALARAFKSLVQLYSDNPNIVLAGHDVHKLVLNAIRAGDPTAARLAAEESILRSAKAYSHMKQEAHKDSAV
jgi:GntR family transcriptional regulator, transcriptional repressor for pyruvate dehydrogenase complex